MRNKQKLGIIVGECRRLCIVLSIAAGMIVFSSLLCSCNTGAANAHFDKGYAAYQKGDFDTAIAEYEKIIRVLSKHPYGLFRKQIITETESVPGGVFSKHL